MTSGDGKGVGFAPCRQDRTKLVELMEGVEDIPGAVMHEGLDWRWESFAEYLDALESGRATSMSAPCCRTPPCGSVMGERAIRHEAATAEDIAQMRAISQAIDAGAFGFSTSRTVSHKSLKGDYTPTFTPMRMN